MMMKFTKIRIRNRFITKKDFFFFFLAFSGFIDSTAEEWDRKQGKRGGVTRSKGIQARSWTWVCCRASAHGMCPLPTELSGAPTKKDLHQQEMSLGE